MNQEPTGAALSAVGGIPAVHGREDVKPCSTTGKQATGPATNLPPMTTGRHPTTLALRSCP